MLNDALCHAGQQLRGKLIAAMMEKPGQKVSSSVLLNDVGKMEEVLYPAIVDLMEQMVLYAVIFMIVFVQSPALAVYMAVISMLAALFGRKGRRQGMELQEKNSAAQEEMLDFLEQTNQGYETIFIYGLHRKMKSGFHDLSSFLSKVQERLQWEADKINVVMIAFLLLASLSSVLLGNIYITRGILSVTQAMAMISLAERLFKPIQRVVNDWYQIAAMKETQKKISSIYSEASDSVSSDSVSAADSFFTSVMKQGLEVMIPSFSLQGKTVLQNIHFSVSPGEKVLLAGPNGCGKSTLLKCILGQYICDDGIFSIDGRNRELMPEAEWNSYFAPVSQNLFLLPGKLIDNVSCFREEKNQEAVQALEFVGLQDIVYRGDSQKLSGGQKQRAAIARAIGSGRKFLVLDEAFSAVDAGNHASIEERLLCDESLTILSVAHRLNRQNFFRFHKVIFLKDGQIQGMGSPEEMQEEAERLWK